MSKIGQDAIKTDNQKQCGVIKVYKTDIPLLKGHITHLINSRYR